uniref:Uncharacterized protein n=1 Tax=Romanomermis culicivorax TaxID=13658 RepID=A0A915HNC1_ROMCU
MSDQNPANTNSADKTADQAPPKRVIPRIIIESPHSPEPRKDRKSGPKLGNRRLITQETDDQPIGKNSVKLSRVKKDKEMYSIDQLESLPCPLKRPQNFLRPEQPFFRTQQKQRSVWFDALSELDVELGWSIASNLVYKQLFNNNACPVPYLSDNFFYFPNFVFLQKPLPFVDQFVRGVKNKV